jgi:hypothetical protein
MRTEELRIGNWVEIDQYGNTRNIIRIDNGSEIDQVVKLNPSPIHLTPDILEKCGFEKKIEDFYRSENLTIVLTKDGSNLYFIGIQEILNAPKYLHQLQNLYYALTGEELTFKP